jgi:hypothetical protein
MRAFEVVVGLARRYPATSLCCSLPEKNKIPKKTKKQKNPVQATLHTVLRRAAVYGGRS